MAHKVKYEGRSISLIEFLSLDISVEAKERIWQQNKVSDGLFLSNQSEIPPQKVAILKSLETANLCNVLKHLISNKKHHQCLNSGLLYHVLVDLKPDTVKTMFIDVDLTFCDHGQLYKALKEAMVRQEVETVKCLVEVFESVLNNVVQTFICQGRLPSGAKVTERNVDTILRSSSDYLVCAFIRYFQAACKPEIPRIEGKKLTSFASLTCQIHTKYKAVRDGSSGVWQRFLRCLVTVDTDLTFLAELIEASESEDTTQHFTPVLEACLSQEILKQLPDPKLQDILKQIGICLNIAMLRPGTTNITSFRTLLKALHGALDVNTCPVPMPKLQCQDILPSSSTCTLLMALSVNEDQDTTPLLRVLLDTFPTEIDIAANHFSAIVLYISTRLGDTDEKDKKVLLCRMNLAYDYFKKNGDIGDLTFADKNGNTALHRVTLRSSLDDFQSIISSVGQFIDPNIQNKDNDTIAIMAAKQQDDKLMTIHKQFESRYNPNMQDATGYTCLMYAVLNQTPDVIRALLRHSEIDMTVRNDYDQNITDIISEEADIDPKIRKMILVAHEKQTQPSAQEKTVDHLISGLQRVVRSPHIDAPTRESFKRQLDMLADDIKHALQGNTMPTVGMLPAHRLKLQGKRVDLLFELDTKDDFMDHLLQDGIINHEKLVEFHGYQTKRERITRFMDHLPYCGDKTYDSFIAALRATDKGYVADMLEAYDPSSAPASDASADCGALVPVTSSVSQCEETGMSDVARLAVQFLQGYVQHGNKL